VNPDPSRLVCEVVRGGERYRARWLGAVDAPASRVRAFAFPERGKLLLVRGDDGLQIPGGGVEPGESVFEALRRELQEEAAASILGSHRLGAFEIHGLTHDLEEIHDFYACRVTLGDEWLPTHDISERVTVDVSEFLDTLPWGRSDPRAAFLLQRAVEVERSLWPRPGT
jgi:8-oxo-dGTP pyrophosphatase MutT (NUDIX family)